MPELTQTVEPSLEQILAPKVAQRQELKELIANLEKSVNNINDDIKTALLTNGVVTILVDGYNVTLDTREKNTLDKRLLLENGVSTDTLANSTKTTSYTQLDVRKAAVK